MSVKKSKDMGRVALGSGKAARDRIERFLADNAAYHVANPGMREYLALLPDAGTEGASVRSGSGKEARGRIEAFLSRNDGQHVEEIV